MEQGKEQEMTLKLPVSQLDQVLNATAQRPWGEVNPVMQNMLAQLDAQRQAATGGAEKGSKQ